MYFGPHVSGTVIAVAILYTLSRVSQTLPDLEAAIELIVLRESLQRDASYIALLARYLIFPDYTISISIGACNFLARTAVAYYLVQQSD